MEDTGAAPHSGRQGEDAQARIQPRRVEKTSLGGSGGVNKLEAGALLLAALSTPLPEKNQARDQSSQRRISRGWAIEASVRGCWVSPAMSVIFLNMYK